MSRIAITGTGAVSPAGWGVASLMAALRSGAELPIDERTRPGREDFPSRLRAVPKPEARLPFFRDPRLRRTSPVGKFVAAAALEALGEERAAEVREGNLRLGVVTTMFCGCVNYSQRFYREVLEDPHTASPIVFPETVFNAPSSHLSAMLGAHSINYTMIGDTAEFLCGLEVATRWLLDGEVDACLVVCGEEFDWLTAEAMSLFEPDCIMAEGGAALYLEVAESGGVQLEQIAGPELITANSPRRAAIERVKQELDLGLDGSGQRGGILIGDAQTWQGGVGGAGGGIEASRFDLRTSLGEGLGVAGGWACVAAVEEVSDGKESAISAIAGLNEHCAAAVFS